MACKVVKREGESDDELIARFKSAVKKSGILMEVRLRECYLNKAQKREMKRKLKENKK